MKRKNVLILLLVFLFLLTPSCVLFVLALETSPFPERVMISEVEMCLDESGGEKAETAIPAVRGEDSREVDLLYALFDCAKRVPRSALPEKNAAYRLTFRGKRPDEVLKLYIGESDLSLYVLTSGKKLYRLAMPTATCRNSVLKPSAASFSLDGEEVVSRYDYPEKPGNPVGIAGIGLAYWQIVTEFAFSGENVSVDYKLYEFNGTLILETADKNEIVERNPDQVLMNVTTALSDRVTVTLHYYLYIEE